MRTLFSTARLGNHTGKIPRQGFGRAGMGRKWPADLTNSKHEIRTADDLKGLKLRLPQSDVMVRGFKALGADVRTLAFPLLYGALQSGEFDGQEDPIATIISSKFNQVQKYFDTIRSCFTNPAILFYRPMILISFAADDKRPFRGGEISWGGITPICSNCREKWRCPIGAIRYAGR